MDPRGTAQTRIIYNNWVCRFIVIQERAGRVFSSLHTGCTVVPSSSRGVSSKVSSDTATIKEILGRGPAHPFPARMAPGIALDVLGSARTRLRILDPMMGSGTVLAVARARGHRAIGYDIDPLSVLIASVWTRSIDEAAVSKKAKDVLSRAQVIFGSSDD